MRVLALNGSARGEKGVTARLLEALAGGMTRGGAEVEVMNVVRMNISPCRACLTCMHKTPGVCVQKDDMETVYRSLQEADLLLLATPVYIDGMTAQLKAVMDRCIASMQPYLARGLRGRVSHPPEWRMPVSFVLLATAGFPERETFEPLIANFRAQARNFGAQSAAELCVPGSIGLQMRPDILEGHLGLLDGAGVELAVAGEVSPATLAKVNRSPLSVDEYLEAAARYEAWCRRTRKE